MLITRPRRFGKTLGMNMLANFHYSVESNREHGEGRSDIVVYDEENSRVVIFEAKVAKSPEELPKRRVMRHCVRSKHDSTQKISGTSTMRSCAMALRFIRSGAWSNENQTENDT